MKSSHFWDSTDDLAHIRSRLALAASPALALRGNEIKAKAAAQSTARRVTPMDPPLQDRRRIKKWFCARRNYTGRGDCFAMRISARDAITGDLVLKFAVVPVGVPLAAC